MDVFDIFRMKIETFSLKNMSKPAITCLDMFLNKKFRFSYKNAKYIIKCPLFYCIFPLYIIFLSEKVFPTRHLI